MTPYYERDGITLFHADCRDVMPTLGKVDAVITDPPYGVQLGKTQGVGGKHGLVRDGYMGFEDTYEFFVSSVVPRINLALDCCSRAGVFTGPHIQEQRKASAIGGVYCPAAAGRHTWGFKCFLPVLFYGTAPNLHKGAKPNILASSAQSEPSGHPCPKPLEWMEWLVDLVSLPGEMILDPFAGSCTTGVAAWRLGRKCILIEVEEKYCEIGAKRLEDEISRGRLFAPPVEPVEQSTLDFGGAANG